TDSMNTTSTQAPAYAPASQARRCQTELQPLIAQLAQARYAVQQLRATVRQAQQAWAAEHNELLTQLDQAERLRQQAEEAVRQAVLQAYQAAGDKRPHPATQVRLRTRLAYDPQRVTEWA